jgi:hypothetical protein
MNNARRLFPMTALIAAILTPAFAQEPANTYALGASTFNISLAQQNCEALGEYDLATWENAADLDVMISLCHGSQQNVPCFTRFLVNDTADGHVSILDGSPMPDFPPEYWQGTPLFTLGKNVMVRWDLPVLYEQQDFGLPLCVARSPLFADGFESGTPSAWSVVVSGS